MPYAIRKRGDKYQVLNTRSGQVKGTHPTKAKATKQMSVLYLIEEDGDDKVRRKDTKRRKK